MNFEFPYRCQSILAVNEMGLRYVLEKYQTLAFTDVLFELRTRTRFLSFVSTLSHTVEQKL